MNAEKHMQRANASHILLKEAARPSNRGNDPSNGSGPLPCPNCALDTDPSNRIIHVLSGELKKVQRSKVLLLVGSFAEGQYKRNISDIDVFCSLTGNSVRMPYINLGELGILTGAVKEAVQALNQRDTHVVAVPPYTAGAFLRYTAKTRIANEKGIESEAVNPVELQVRLYYSLDEAILSEKPSLLESFLRTGKPLLGSEPVYSSREYIIRHVLNDEKDPLAENILNQRRKLISGFVTFASNINLPYDVLFEEALTKTKEVIVALTEESLRSRGVSPPDWSFSILMMNKERFSSEIKEHVELINEQRTLMRDEVSPIITTGELYSKTVNAFNILVSELLYDRKA